MDVIEGMTGWRLKGRVNTELAVGGGAKQRSAITIAGHEQGCAFQVCNSKPVATCFNELHERRNVFTSARDARMRITFRLSPGSVRHQVLFTAHPDWRVRRGAVLPCHAAERHGDIYPACSRRPALASLCRSQRSDGRLRTYPHAV